MCRHPMARRTLLSVLIAATGMPPLAGAEQLSLVQYPAGSASRQPAPNVIVTLDDSSSMRYNLAGTDVGEKNAASGMYALKQALQEAFSASAQNIPDGSIRMAWNAMNNCRSIPTTSGGCANLNGMRVLDATHRANFLNWVGTAGANANTSKLRAEGGTPTHQAFVAAGDYLANASTTSASSPWAAVPGTTLEPVLSCRRSYNVLMTDGGWSWEGPNLGAGVSRPNTTNPNADGTTLTLPDGQIYDITQNYTRVYRDAFGGQSQGRTYNSATMTKGAVSTLSDLAFYYWATDLSSSLTNNLVPAMRQTEPQTFTSSNGSTSVTLPQYWNPRNNPATWQHMTTYTIGFRDAASWPNNGTYPNWDATNNDMFGGSFPDLVTGARLWPSPIGTDTLVLTSVTEETRKMELWHMAINSRGKFIPTYSAADLVRAFKDIFGEIAVDTSTPVTSFANSASSISRSSTTQYTSGYEAADWRGYVLADTLAQGTGAAAPDEGWGTKVGNPRNVTTADKLNALDAAGIASRLILTWSEVPANGAGTSFQWTQDLATLSALSAAQKDLLKAEGTGTVSDTVGEQRLNFIRGDRSQEGGTWRRRGSRQGDIVNSALWYVASPVASHGFSNYLAFARRHKDRLPMVYVGGNDGMLHGFSGKDGSEKIAYVPKGVLQNLHELTRSSYQHRYYVDGSPFSGDAFIPPRVGADPEWRTVLVGTLGAGGKGYFVLDVTSPGSTVTNDSAVASEFLKANAASLVIMDKTAHPSVSVAATTDAADIGHIMAAPVLQDGNPQNTTQIVRMNDGRWAVVMGNGYNSTNERPVLLIQYLDGDKSLRKLVAATTGTNATTNGLSAPRLVDIDGNGTPDVIYAGDLRGNLWKFDVLSATAAEWNVAFSGTPLYTAANVVGNVSTPQPITAPPLVRANNRGAGGVMVAFGTGRNITEADRTGVAVQSIYSVLDNTMYRQQSAGRLVIDNAAATPAPVTGGVASLVEQEVQTQIAGSGSNAAHTFWTISENNVSYTGDVQKKGWYLKLPQTGERVLAQMSFYDGSNVIELISEVPASGGSTAGESCSPQSTAVRKYRTLLNIMDGKRPSLQIMDTDGNGEYSLGDDGGATRMTAGQRENRILTPDETIIKGPSGASGINSGTDLARYGPPLRPNWRQLQ